MEIDEFHHSDSVWTWRPNTRRRKASLWLPYFESVERLPKGKGDRYRFSYNGGEIECHLKGIDFLMFYGASGSLPIAFLDKLNTYRIPLMIHRRNMPRPYLFFPDIGEQEIDVLSEQVRARDNQIRRCYIARTLIRERLRNFEDHIEITDTHLRSLARARSVKRIRQIESEHSRRYWKAWYASNGHPDVSRRNRNHFVNEALNAGSFFLSGILLRWVLFHKMSPNHGYLHTPTSYSALIYDLIEPYRYLVEDSVVAALEKVGEGDESRLTGAALSAIKLTLEKEVYVPAPRQTVRQKNLLHGCVLALRSYLIGETRKLVIPVRGIKKGGRPLKVAYRLPGAR